MPAARERLARALGDRYRVEQELGRGGMGVVLLAHDLKHDRRVAVKVLREEIAESVNGERFLREIRIAAQLQHPNILHLIDSGTVDGLAYYVMPYVDGESLRQRLDRESQLPLDDAIEIAREVADALGYAHDLGVIHRDIKPENIMLAAGHALVADFGVARAVDTAVGETLTATGIAIGTPTYMSPEQADGTGMLDHRSDIYSLGCVLYEMLAGAPPYVGRSPMAIIARKAVDPIPSLHAVRNAVTADIEGVVDRALARSPADRFGTSRDFAAALAIARADGAGSVGGRQGWRSHTPRAGRRRWLLTGTAGAVVLIAGVYALVAGRPRWSATTPVVESVAQLTAAPGREWFPSLSADGKWIVYAGVQSGNADIYLQSVGGQVPINLTKDSPDDDDQPAFSRDGERIAFRSSRANGGIFVMGRTGEAVHRVTSLGYRPTWSPDGTQLAYVSENVELNPGNSESLSELWIVNADGTQPRKLQTGDAVFPSWSPHGQRIAYARRLGAPAQADIYTVAPGDKAPVPLTEDRATDWAPVWSPDGRYVYFASDRSGSMNLWRIAIDEETGQGRGDPEPVTTPATYLAHPTMSGDGHRIAYTSGQTSINIQRIAFDPASGSVIGEPTSVTSGSRQWSTPDPSPDGDWVAFYTLTAARGPHLRRASGRLRVASTDLRHGDRSHAAVVERRQLDRDVLQPRGPVESLEDPRGRQRSSAHHPGAGGVHRVVAGWHPHRNRDRHQSIEPRQHADDHRSRSHAGR